MKWLWRFFLVFLAGLLAPTGWAGSNGGDTSSAPPSPGADKSHYNLFQPTPDNLLRSFSADRPSQSLGPYTVDAGHYYFETSVVSYLFDEPGDGTRVRQWNIAPINFRIGLTNNVELDLAYGDYVHLRIEDRATGQATTKNGFGDFIVQSKINLLGNDGGKFSFGLIPFLKFPTNTNDLGNDSVEGGLGLPLAIALPGGFSLGLETGVNFVRNGDDDGYDPVFLNAILVSHTVFSDKVSVYGEFFSLVNGSTSTVSAYIDTGLVYQILPNAEIDLGCNFGVTNAAADFQPFTGFSFRF